MSTLRIVHPWSFQFCFALAIYTWHQQKLCCYSCTNLFFYIFHVRILQKKRIHSQSNAIAKMSVEIKLKVFRSYSFKNHFISRRYRRSIMEREKNRGLFESLRVGKTLPMWTMPYAWVCVCACGWCRACCQERTMSVAIWRSYWYEMNAIHSKHSN